MKITPALHKLLASLTLATAISLSAAADETVTYLLNDTTKEWPETHISVAPKEGGNTIIINGVDKTSSDVTAANVTLASGDVSVSDNTIEISKSSVNTVNGGFSDASGNSVGNNNTIKISEKSTVWQVYGASLQGNGQETNLNTITISDSTVTGTYITGGSCLKEASENTITITDSNFTRESYVRICGGTAQIANGNKITLENTTFASNKEDADIIGARGQGATTTTAQNNSITLKGTKCHLENASLYGYQPVYQGTVTHSGNTLVLDGFQGTVKSINNFDAITIKLDSWTAGETILTLTNTFTYTETTPLALTLDFSACDMSEAEGAVTLISGFSVEEEDLALTLTGMEEKAVTLVIEDGQLIAKVGSDELTPSLNPQYKALADGRIAALTLNNRAGNLVAENGVAQAALAAAAPQDASGMATYFALSAGHDKVDSGSHVDVDGLSALLGASIGLMKDKALTLGGFVESGWGQYTTHNSFADAAPVRGTGETSYAGGGVLARYAVNALPGLAVDASLRAGRQDADFSTADIADTHAAYDLSSSYIAGHLGTSYSFAPADRLEATVYARYLWSHLGSDHADMNGERLDFASAHSNRLRVGTRATWTPCCRVQRYVGLAYEWECSGSARATVGGERLAAPSMRGGSLIGEIGTAWQPWETRPLWLSAGLTGSVGKVQGYGANIGCMLAF